MSCHNEEVFTGNSKKRRGCWAQGPGDRGDNVTGRDRIGQSLISMIRFITAYSHGKYTLGGT